MLETTIGDILADLNVATTSDGMKTGRCSVTIWLPPEAKARYDVLQERTRRRFSKKAREALLALIDAAEERVPLR